MQSYECKSARKSFEQPIEEDEDDLPVQTSPAEILEKPLKIAETLSKTTRTRDNATWSTTSSNRGPPSQRGKDEEQRRTVNSARGEKKHPTVGTHDADVDNIVNELRTTDRHRTSAVVEKFRALNSKKPGIGSAMVRGGAVEMMVGQLAIRFGK